MDTKSNVNYLLLSLCLNAVNQPALAACSFSGTIERVYQATETGFIYMLPKNNRGASYYRYFSSDDRKVLAAAHAAKLGHQPVKVKGDADSCPPINMTRYGSYGGAITMIKNR